MKGQQASELYWRDGHHSNKIYSLSWGFYNGGRELCLIWPKIFQVCSGGLRSATAYDLQCFHTHPSIKWPLMPHRLMHCPPGMDHSSGLPFICHLLVIVSFRVDFCPLRLLPWRKYVALNSYTVLDKVGPVFMNTIMCIGLCATGLMNIMCGSVCQVE